MYNFDPSIFISIHAPPRGATVRPCANGNVLGFQFTPLREGRHKAFVDKFKPKLFQFTPLREGRRPSTPKSDYSAYISIHAPPRGATYCVDVFNKPQNISIHAPPRGATRVNSSIKFFDYFNSRPSARGDCISKAISGCEARFQFTPLREGRHSFARAVYLHQFISIHAPPRGATRQLQVVR